LEAETVLHLKRDGAAKRIEAEQRITAEHCDGPRRVRGQEIPIDDIAEHLVDAHPVLIDGKALRDTIDGRRLEAAVLHARLEGVSLRVGDDDPWTSC
jgi:hypothetical protein